MLKPMLLFVFFFGILEGIPAQKVIFLHHSTGGGVYSEGDVPGWIASYNAAHATNYSIVERAYPDTPYPWENYPFDYWNLWVNPSTPCDNSQPGVACIGSLVSEYDVIVFKHCFPGAGIEADGITSSVSSSEKTQENYKLQYRALREMMDSYPDNQFIVWTLAPLHRYATSPEDAARAGQFVEWVKNEWLKEDGKDHANIFVFDFWGIVAETDSSPAKGLVNCLKYDYESSHTGSDSHPNTFANQTAGPLFARFIVSTLELHTGTGETVKPDDDCKVTVQPGKAVTVEIEDVNIRTAGFSLFDISGRLVFKSAVTRRTQTFILPELSPGIYCYLVSGGTITGKGKVVLEE